VVKRFGDFVAVRGLDLDIERGEFFTLLGPSGCGKTTTLRMIAGFEKPSEGRLRLDGSDVSGLPAFKRPTNTVFQSYALFPHLNVEKNVAFGLERSKLPKDAVRRRVAEELERLMKAQASRGADFGRPGRLQFIQRTRQLIPVTVPLFVSAFRRAAGRGGQAQAASALGRPAAAGGAGPGAGQPPSRPSS